LSRGERNNSSKLKPLNRANVENGETDENPRHRGQPLRARRKRAEALEAAMPQFDA
jgi:hypothetical protein